jgi:alpha-tubulin suppressor-like RCC1 family protein
VIGDGTRANHNTPTQEASAAEDWVEVDGGNYHTVAIKSDGTLWGWGYNNYGQLTDGLNAWRYAPEIIGGEEKWSQASASQYHTAALKESNSVLLWGTVAGAHDMASD